MRGGKCHYVVGTLFCFLFLGLSSAFAQSAPPTIFYTDLTSGPNSGGESVSGFAGAYVTLYGNDFGNSAPTITLNGQNCLRLVGAPTPYLWYQRQVVQLGTGCSSGGFVVVTSAGSSNSVSFSVRPGNILCVKVGGSDSNSGTFASGCWATVPHAAHTIGAGDIAYIGNGVVQSGIDDYGASIATKSAGTAGNPIALVGYPGATATIGSANNGWAIRSPQISGGPFSHWVFANLTLIGHDSLEANSVDDWRIVANNASCPNGNSQDACFHGSQATNTVWYGNYVHDSGTNCTPSGDCKEYHAVYMSTDTNHVQMAWNDVNPDPNNTGQAGCRAIQFNSSPLGGGSGLDQYDLHVHDNLVRNAICDGINFNTVNADAGTVEAYNNVIYHVGKGPDPTGGQANYTCFNIGSASTHTNPVLIYNNTMYDCGGRGSSGDSDVGMFSAYIKIRIYNNIIYQSNSGVPYLSVTTATYCSSAFSGSNNDWYGAGAKPSCVGTSGDQSNVNPQMTNPSVANFTLTSSSPLIGAGTTAQRPVYDYAGLIRPSPPSIGAQEYGSGATTVQRPNPPTGLTATVQ